MNGQAHEKAPLGRRFLTVWAGQTASAIGSMVSGVGVSVYVFVETGSATWLGVLAALASVPYVLTTPLLPLADRYARRTVMIAADTFAVLGPAIALILAVTNRLEIWHLAVAGFAGGIGNAFQWPASQAAIPALVDATALDRANGLSQLGTAGGIVVGPAVATPLIAFWGIEAVLIADLVTFLIAVAATLSVRFDDVADDSGVVDDRTWSAVWEWLRGPGRPLITILAAMAAANFLLAFFNVSILVLATDLGGTARAGLVLGSAGAAMVVGSLVSAKLGAPTNRVKTIAVGLAIAGGGLVLASLRPSFVLVIAGVVIAFAALPILNAATSTIFHEQVPTTMQGRMFGLRAALGRSLEPIGSVLAGLTLADLAEPAMRPGGALSSTVGQIIGIGEDRGAALVLAAVGTALAAIGIWLATSPVSEQLRSHAPAEAKSAPASQLTDE